MVGLRASCWPLLVACLCVVLLVQGAVSATPSTDAPTAAANKTSPPSADPHQFSLELLDWALGQGIIDARQHASLADETERRSALLAAEKASEEAPSLLRRSVSAVASHLTLINVLYFFGALLVIGAMTLFMTIGWESFGGWGIFTIATGYGLLFALIGRHFWNPIQDEGGNTLGGLLFTMAVAMTPLAVYGVERATGYWPSGSSGLYADYYRYVKASWLPMEIATCVVGAVVVYFVRFPFLTMPVAFSLWFMSMDLVPVLLGKSSWNWEDRTKVSMYFGAVVLAGAWYVDQWLALTQDFAFWFYLTGVVTFWSGLTTQKSNHEVGGVIYLAINAAMIIFAQMYDRVIFSLFGFVGVVLISCRVAYKLEIKHTPFVYARAIVGVTLLLAALKWHIFIPFAAGLIVLGTYGGLLGAKTVNWPEPLHWGHLLLHLGLYESSSLFAGDAVMTPILGFDGQHLLALVAGALLLLFHLPWTVSSNRWFAAYRVALCYASMLASVYFPVLLYVGALGLAFYAWDSTSQYIGQQRFAKAMLCELYGVTSVLISIMFDSRIVFYLAVFMCCIGPRLVERDSLSGIRGVFVCVASVSVVWVAVLAQSQFLMCLGGFGVFCYLSYLSHHVFRNSLLFPFALVVVGLGVLFLGYQYQKHQDGLRLALLGLLPVRIEPSLFDLSNVSYAAPEWLQPVMGWFGLVANQTASLPDYSLLLYLAAVVVIALLVVALERVFAVRLDKGAQLPLQSAEVIWPQNTSDHGLVFRVRGFKPAELNVTQAYLCMEGPAVWSHFERNVGHTAVNVFRYAFHPLRLCPDYMDPAPLCDGATDQFTVDLDLGTGARNTPRVSHATLIRHLTVLRNSGDWSFSLQVVERSGLLGLKRRLLFELPLTAGTLLAAQQSANKRATLQL